MTSPMLTLVHFGGGQDGNCIEVFGTATAKEMFQVASPEGIQLIGEPIKPLTKPVKAYRACTRHSPRRTASGMCWTFNPEVAFDWFNGDEPGTIVSSIIQPADILVTFENGQHAVVYPNANRQFDQMEADCSNGSNEDNSEGV